MYNGIGLTSTRGSGTNGYVQRNLSFVRASRMRPVQQGEEFAPPQPRKPNAEILEHERKRQVEVKLLELRVAMEDRGCGAACRAQPTCSR